MNTPQVLRSPRIGLLIVALVLLVAFLLAVLIPLAWSLINIARAASPIEADSLKMVDAFHSAINSDNVDAVLALFAKDATVKDSGSVMKGTEEIRSWLLSSQRMAGLYLTMLRSENHKDRTTWIDAAYNAPEVQHRTYLLRWTAVIQNGKIQSLQVSQLPMSDGK